MEEVIEDMKIYCGWDESVHPDEFAEMSAKFKGARLQFLDSQTSNDDIDLAAWEAA